MRSAVRKAALRDHESFELIPPSPKQLKLMSWWTPRSPYADWDGIISDGSIRSGKTVGNIISFMTWSLETFSNERFILAGRSVGALERNVVDPLKKIMRSQRRSVYHHRSGNWLLVGSNIYYLFGGRDERAKDDVAGITAAGALVDEVTRLPESFVKEVMNRCSVEGSKYFLNCNPGPPQHWFKTDWIDKAPDKRLLRLHFTMRDNAALSRSVRERYTRLYTGLWHKRYVLGLWVAASGVIFSMFDAEEHCQPTNDRMRRLGIDRWDSVVMGVDYGTQNPFALGIYGLARSGGRRYAHKMGEYHYCGRDRGVQKTDSQYADAVESFWRDYVSERPRAIVVDPSAASFITELRARGWHVIPADNDVEDGNRWHAQMLTSGRFSVDPTCQHSIAEYGAYTWDPKAQDRGEDKPLKENDHHMDEQRYVLYTMLAKRKAAKLGTIAR